MTSLLSLQLNYAANELLFQPAQCFKKESDSLFSKANVLLSAGTVGNLKQWTGKRKNHFKLSCLAKQAQSFRVRHGTKKRDDPQKCLDK